MRAPRGSAYRAAAYHAAACRAAASRLLAHRLGSPVHSFFLLLMLLRMLKPVRARAHAGCARVPLRASHGPRVAAPRGGAAVRAAHLHAPLRHTGGRACRGEGCMLLCGHCGHAQCSAIAARVARWRHWLPSASTLSTLAPLAQHAEHAVAGPVRAGAREGAGAGAAAVQPGGAGDVHAQRRRAVPQCLMFCSSLLRASTCVRVRALGALASARVSPGSPSVRSTPHWPSIGPTRTPGPRGAPGRPGQVRARLPKLARPPQALPVLPQPQHPRTGLE